MKVISYKALGESFKTFLFEEFNYELYQTDDNFVLIYIPISSCTPCVDISIDVLTNLSTQFDPVMGILTSRYKKDFIRHEDYLYTDKYYVAFKGENLKYNLNIGTPVAILFTENEIIDIMEITEANFNQVSQSIIHFLE